MPMPRGSCQAQAIASSEVRQESYGFDCEGKTWHWNEERHLQYLCNNYYSDHDLHNPELYKDILSPDSFAKLLFPRKITLSEKKIGVSAIFLNFGESFSTRIAGQVKTLSFWCKWMTSGF